MVEGSSAGLRGAARRLVFPVSTYPLFSLHTPEAKKWGGGCLPGLWVLCVPGPTGLFPRVSKFQAPGFGSNNKVCFASHNLKRLSNLLFFSLPGGGFAVSSSDLPDTLEGVH